MVRFLPFFQWPEAFQMHDPTAIVEREGSGSSGAS
jgi:hypothetical protein